jgi:hypothetical protein
MTGIISDNVGRPSGLIKAAAGGGGVWTLIKTLTASSSSTLSFVHGSSDVVLDSTYPIYVFKFINMHPSAHIEFAFNASIDTGSNYNVAKTTTTVASWHAENGASGGISYIDEDLANGTGVARISGNTYTDNDSSMSGEMFLFNPSSTVFVKHFMADTQRMDYSSQGYTNRWLSAGYINSTSAVDAIQFSMVSGTFDGKIKLYGLKDSA